ncbi:hypothetical protein CANDROIZ_650003 [Candidatus Roizmanbacteria bacterium]|nr:hypothetical protein CANDROIZ_650003 [Candidatus Roizmanbacteria bacterium]
MYETEIISYKYFLKKLFISQSLITYKSSKLDCYERKKMSIDNKYV